MRITTLFFGSAFIVFAIAATLNPAHAQSFGWTQFAVISPTSPISNSTVGDLCFTDGKYIACNDNAPKIDMVTGGLGIGSRTFNASLTVVGAIHAIEICDINGQNCGAAGGGGPGEVATGEDANVCDGTDDHNKLRVNPATNKLQICYWPY